MTHKEFENWMNSVSYTEWMEWAKKPSENRNGRKNILPEIVDYLSDHPEEFCKPTQLIEGHPHVIAPEVSPRTWLAVSETLIDQCLEAVFGQKYDSIDSIPKEEIIRLVSGIIGDDVAERFANYIMQAKHS